MTSKDHHAPDAPASSSRSLVDFLALCLDHRSIIIVDGVDECDDSETFVSALKKLCQGSSCKLIAFSRVHVAQLQQAVPSQFRLALPKDLMEADIRLYSQRETQELIEDELLPESAEDSVDEIIDRMVMGADGMFLWARLMVKFLRSPALSQGQRMRVIHDIHFPEGLEKMYDRIGDFIRGSGETTYKLASHTLTWLVFRATTMSTTQTRQALSINGIWPIGSSDEDVREFENAALIACAGLAEVVSLPSTRSAVRVLKLTHVSVKDVLIRQRSLIEPQPESALCDDGGMSFYYRQNLRLAAICIKQLLYHTPAHPLSSKFHVSLTAADLSLMLPFTDYAALYWIHHTTAIDFGDIEERVSLNRSFLTLFQDYSVELKRFLGTPKAVSVWLEAHYTMQSGSSPSGAAMRRWASSLSELSQSGSLKVDSGLLALIFEFRTDLDRIVTRWEQTLRLTPHVIWDEANAINFSYSTLFFCPDTTRATSRAPRRPEMLGQEAKMLLSTSSTSTDGSLLGVLSLWMSHSSKRQDTHSESPELKKSRAWTVCYDLWPMDTQRPQLANVIRHVDQVVFEGLQYTPRLLSISPDALAFSVANRIWKLIPDSTSCFIGLSEQPWKSPVRCGSATLQGERTGPREMLSTVFSPTLQYAVVIEKFRTVNTRDDLRLEPHFDAPQPAFKQTAYEIFKSPGQPIDGDLDSALALPTKKLNSFTSNNASSLIFHPYLPLAAIEEPQSLLLWSFTSSTLGDSPNALSRPNSANR